MPTAKQEVNNLLARLPDDCSLEDVWTEGCGRGKGLHTRREPDDKMARKVI